MLKSFLLNILVKVHEEYKAFPLIKCSLGCIKIMYTMSMVGIFKCHSIVDVTVYRTAVPYLLIVFRPGPCKVKKSTDLLHEHP